MTEVIVIEYIHIYKIVNTFTHCKWWIILFKKLNLKPMHHSRIEFGKSIGKVE